ncbi:alpha/beta fold hydrolase [Nocardia sp. NPDC057663]|uniref:alpha/beta fold hydrolase n=1 Tax=Nocardia sp. NPDC057663 TaxID=3346201 RepID=UPI00366F6140
MSADDTGAASEQVVTLPHGSRICYRLDGPADGEPLVLIAGLSLDLRSWPEPMVDRLVDAGFRVVRLDNRDVGRSSAGNGKPPGNARILFKRPRQDAYTLADMADDVLALLDHLEIGAAHLVGMSMGGMIAQTLAARHPARVVTLTSIFSTTGNVKVGQPALSTWVRMARRPPRTVDEAVAAHLTMLRHIGSTVFAPDEAVERNLAAVAWIRGAGPRAQAGIARQIGAIQASGDRSAEISAILAPTLVIHGDTDPMVHPSGGRATAAAVPGARHIEIPGMRHHLAPGVLDRLARLITDHARVTRSAGDPV